MNFFQLLLCCCSIISATGGLIKISDNNISDNKPHQNLLNDDDIRNGEELTNTHVFRERIPRRLSRTDILRLGRAHHNYNHEVIFVIQQRNIDELTRVLHDVSNPSSPNYGLHWTIDEVTDLTSNPEASDAVVSYLYSAGVSIVSETLRGEFITAAAPIKIWEKMFNTEFYTFHQTHRDKRAEHLIRAEKYWMPRELDSHVGHVFNIVEMPIGARGRLTKQTRTSSVSAMASDPTKWTENGIITPYKLKVYYNMSNNVRGNKFSTQTIFASNGQYFSPNDMAAFQTRAGLPLNAVTPLNGHSSDNKCVEDLVNCYESNLDLQYISAMSPSSPTTHRYTDGDFTSWLVSVASDRNPSRVLSLSYVNDEAGNNPGTLETWTTFAIKMGTIGVTILSASGDDGANSYRAQENVSFCGYIPLFPASCPYVLSIGATSGTQHGVEEIVAQSNNFLGFTSGGGFSSYYSVPSFQSAAVNDYFAAAKIAGTTPYPGYGSGRGYPDMSFAGSGYAVIIGGQTNTLAGTSASCPAVAGLISSINAARMMIGKGSVGWVNPAIYANGSSFVNDVTSGHIRCPGGGGILCCKQGYTATHGWDPASGLGSVNYGRMQEILVSLGPVGSLNPPTASPTFRPTATPTSSPSFIPTRAPTARPTLLPTRSPTSRPTATPTSSPSFTPTRTPTARPTLLPTRSPTSRPTATPTSSPSFIPTRTPTARPTLLPTRSPTARSSTTALPTTASPSYSPSIKLSMPTYKPSTLTLSSSPMLTTKPSTVTLSSHPTAAPSATSTISPSYLSSVKPTNSTNAPSTSTLSSSPMVTNAPSTVTMSSSPMVTTKPSAVTMSSSPMVTNAPLIVTMSSSPMVTNAPLTVTMSSSPMVTNAPSTVTMSSSPMVTNAPSTVTMSSSPMVTNAPSTVTMSSSPMVTNAPSTVTMSSSPMVTNAPSTVTMSSSPMVTNAPSTFTLSRIPTAAPSATSTVSSTTSLIYRYTRTDYPVTTPTSLVTALAPSEVYVVVLKAFTTLSGTTLSGPSKAALSSAIIISVSETVELAASAVTDVTLTVGRRMLLSDVTISYTLTVVSDKNFDYYFGALQTSVMNGNFLKSLLSNSGVPIDGAFDFRSTDYSPTASPVNALTRGSDQSVRDLAGSIAGGVIGAFFLVAAIIIVACFYKRSRPVSSPRLKIQL